MAESTISLQRQLATKDEQITALTAQVATLTTTISQLTQALQCFPAKAAGQEEDKSNKRKREGGPRVPKKRNMGGYCHTHGFDPVGVDHNSQTCHKKRRNHKDEATAQNTMGGYLKQPKKEEIHPDQQAQWVNRA